MAVARVGISLEAELVKKIDDARGDVTRSRFIQRILERYFPINQKGEVPPKGPTPASQPRSSPAAGASDD